jgi:hypothetical protein
MARVYSNMAALYQRQGKHRKERKMADKANSFRALESSTTWPGLLRRSFGMMRVTSPRKIISAALLSQAPASRQFFRLGT